VGANTGNRQAPRKTSLEMILLKNPEL